jgi:hypothetical protein
MEYDGSPSQGASEVDLAVGAIEELNEERWSRLLPELLTRN